MRILTRKEYRACVDPAILWQRIDWRNTALRSMQKLLQEERIKSCELRRELDEIKDDINSETLSGLRRDSTPQNHQLIIRPSNSKPIRVLEVDGPREKHVQRGEGFYYLNTSNHPMVDQITQNMEMAGLNVHDPRFKSWDAPHWEIYQMNDGSIEIHANRPSYQETMRGDLHGKWGTVLVLRNSHRYALKTGLWMARLFLRCIPTEGIKVRDIHLLWFREIHTDIPISVWSAFPDHPFTHPTMPEFNRQIGCAACDRGDFQLGHHHNCPRR